MARRVQQRESVLPRVVLGASLLILVAPAARAAHGDPTDTLPADATDAAPRHRIEGVVGTGGAGARYSFVNDALHIELQASGERDRVGAAGRIGLARFGAFEMDHEIVAGFGIVRAAAESSQFTDPMVTSAASLRREHRFLSAYINDTVRFIRGLDITGGLVVEQWQNLGGDSTITYGSGPPMIPETPDYSFVFAPTVSVTAHVTDRVSLVAQTLAGIHELGPSISAGRLSGRARVFTSPRLGSGVAAEASVQPIAPLIASVGYVRAATLTRAAASLTLTEPRIATITTRVDTASVVDALAVRRLRGGISGFVSVDNALDRPADTDATPLDAFAVAPRTFSLGVRGYFPIGAP